MYHGGAIRYQKDCFTSIISNFNLFMFIILSQPLLAEMLTNLIHQIILRQSCPQCLRSTLNEIMDMRLASSWQICQSFGCRLMRSEFTTVLAATTIVPAPLSGVCEAPATTEVITDSMDVEVFELSSAFYLLYFTLLLPTVL